MKIISGEREMSRRREQKRDEVEELLEAAQEEMMLKLSVDTHMSRVSPNYLDPDLHRRFQTLKSRPSVQSSDNQRHKSVDGELKTVSGDDLSARFAALKASLHNSSSSTSGSVGVGPTKKTDGQDQRMEGHVEDEEEEEDEVDKVIRWAMDAARLDPSPPSDDDHDLDGVGSDDDGGDDDDDDPRKGRRV